MPPRTLTLEGSSVDSVFTKDISSATESTVECRTPTEDVVDVLPTDAWQRAVNFRFSASNAGGFGTYNS